MNRRSRCIPTNRIPRCLQKYLVFMGRSTHRFPFSLSYLHSFPSNAFDRFYFPLNCGGSRMAWRVHRRSRRAFSSNLTSRLAAPAVRPTQRPLKCEKRVGRCFQVTNNDPFAFYLSAWKTQMPAPCRRSRLWESTSCRSRDKSPTR